MTNFIWVTNQKELFHRYPDAPDEVSFLKNRHRHIFHFKTYIEVKHNDRDVEFIMFKKFIQSFLDNFKAILCDKSCEMISDDLYEVIKEKYPEREVRIEVSEDGENGSLKMYR